MQHMVEYLITYTLDASGGQRYLIVEEFLNIFFVEVVAEVCW